MKEKREGDIPVFDVGTAYKLVLNSAHAIRSSTTFNSINCRDEVYVIGGENSSGQDSQKFTLVFLCRIMYFSYRNCFKSLPNGGTTDAGWGCLLRAAQMLMSVALLRASKNGNIHVSRDETFVDDEIYREVESLFMDDPTAQFSIHRLHDEACKAGAPSKSYLSPTNVGDALVGANSTPRSFSHLKCIRTSVIEKQKLFYLTQESPILLLIPVVCGYKTIAYIYQNALLEFIRFPCCNGLLVGRKQAGYFAFGHQRRNLLCLDPHYIQKAYISSSTRGRQKGKCCTFPAANIEPSVLISFYIHCNEDLDNLCIFLRGVNSKLPLPLISVVD